MDPSSEHHYQDMSINSLERKPRPPAEQAQKCPRCDSTNTKFCYYNNYSLSQPRYFCKSCRRYWTKGGTLRNVPVGGGCRKNKRSSSKRTPDHQQPEMITTNNQNALSSFSNPLINYDSHDLTLAFARLQKQTNGQLGFDSDHDNLSIIANHSETIYGNPISNSADATHPEFLEAIRGNFLETHATNGNFQNLYYGFGNNIQHLGEVQNSAGINGVDKVLWGFPWQINGDGNMGNLDSGRESWNGFAAPWHGLLNSPLM